MLIDHLTYIYTTVTIIVVWLITLLIIKLTGNAKKKYTAVIIVIGTVAWLSLVSLGGASPLVYIINGVK